jgi:hypothetical protein
MKTAIAAADAPDPRQVQLHRLRDVLVVALRDRFDQVMEAYSRIELGGDEPQ